MSSIFQIPPLHFEELSVEYLRSKGFLNVVRVGRAGDLGIDIRCTDPQGRLVVAQCKRYQADRNITSPDIQKFFGMVVHAGASRAIYITTSNFTQPARNLARDRDIELIDGSQIAAFYDQKYPSRLRPEPRMQPPATVAERTEKTQKNLLGGIRSWLESNTSATPAKSHPPSKVDKPRPKHSTRQQNGSLDKSLYSQKFCFEHVGGDILYPVRIRNSKSGRMEFQVWDKDKSRTRGVGEEEMVDLVLNKGYAVRMKCPTTGRNGGYKKAGPSIRRVIRH